VDVASVLELADINDFIRLSQIRLSSDSMMFMIFIFIFFDVIVGKFVCVSLMLYFFISIF
jgi:hypothetical protein